MEEEVSEQSIALDPGRHRDSWNRPKAYCLALYRQGNILFNTWETDFQRITMVSRVEGSIDAGLTPLSLLRA